MRAMDLIWSKKSIDLPKQGIYLNDVLEFTLLYFTLA